MVEYQDIDEILDKFCLKNIEDTTDRTKAHEILSKVHKDDLITYIIMMKAEQQRSYR